MSPPPMSPRKSSLALALPNPSQSQTLPSSRPPSPSWIVSEPSTESVARVAGCVQTAFSELNPLDDQDSTRISKLQRSLSSTALSDQREAAITGAYILAKREKWQRLEPLVDDLNTLTNACGLTALMVAVSEGDETAAQGLVENGISAFSKNAQGTSALHLAARRGSSQMMEIVQDSAGNVDKTDAFMRTPLHEAVFHNNTEAVQHLVHNLAAKLDSPAPYAPGLWDEGPVVKGAEAEETPAQETSHERTNLMASPVTLAVLLGHSECFDIMMQRQDARTELTSSDIGNLCHVAVHFRQMAMLEHLLKNYSEFAQRYLKGEDAKGLTPAGVAAATGDIDSLEVIYRYAPRTILAKDRCGRTPVHWAAEGLHTEVLEFYGKHIPPQIACFEELSTSIGGYDAKNAITILQDLLKQRPQDLKTQQAASAGQRIMRQHKLGKLQSKEILSKSLTTFLPTPATRTFAVPSKKQYEVERTELLGQIEEAFTDNHLVVLHGITGTGKTHLASAFGRKQAREKEVYWIEASVEGIVPSYIKLAKKLGLITEEDLKTSRGQEQAVDRVMKYFSKRSDCLLILDDVTSEEELSFEGISLIPEGGAQVLLTRVLITSQSDLFSEGQLVQVEKLTEQEALELFTKTIRKPAPEELLSELSERLFYHPLLINMTGCYIRQMNLRQRTKPLETIIREEIDRLKESSMHLPQGRKDAIIKEVEKRWVLNLARAKEEDGHVEETLGICAYFAPTGIPVGWFEGALGESFGVLEAFGFCHFEEKERVNMHGLVQRLSRRKDNQHLALQAAADIVEKKWEYTGEEFNIAEEVKQNAAHVEQALEHLIKAEVHTEQVAGLLRVLGVFQRVGTFFKASQKTWEESLKILRAIHGQKTPHPCVAQVLMNLGLVALQQGELGLAKERLEQVLGMMQALYEQKAPHPDVAGVLMNLGLVALQQGELGLAKERLEQVLGMMQALYEQKAPHPDVAGVLMNLGLVALQQGELGLAKEHFEQALGMMQTLYGQGAPHPDVAQVLSNLGLVALQQGELGLAKERLEQVLGMMQALYEQKAPHPDVAGVLMNLGLVALQQGELGLAKERLEQVLGMMQALYGQGAPHPDVAQVLSNLGAVALGQGELGLAKEHLEQALGMMQTLYGQGAPHPDVAQVLSNLGAVALGQGELGLAKERLEQVLGMMQALYEQKAPHPDVAGVLMNLGAVALGQGELGLAKEHLEQALGMMQALYEQGAPHPDVAQVLMNLGVVALQQGELGLAKEHLEQALGMMQALYEQGAPHPDVAQVLSNLGVVALQQGELGLAKERLEQALGMMQAFYGQKTPHPHVTQVLMNLGVVALQQGELGLAKEHLEQALGMMQALYEQGAPHPDVAQVLSNLGAVALQQGELGLAKEHLEQALGMMQAFYGQKTPHPHVALVLMNLGLVALGQGELGLAKEQLEQALGMMQALYGRGTPHPNVAQVLMNLGEVSRQQGELGLAKERFEQALGMMQVLYGKGVQHPDLVKVLLSLGLVNKELGNLAHARDFLSKSLTMARAIYRTDAHPIIQIALGQLADLGAEQDQTIKLFKRGKKHYVKGEYTAAQALLEQALTKFKEASDTKRGGACSIFYGAALRHLGDPAAEKFLEEGIAKVKAYTDQASQIHLSVGLLELGVLCIAQGKKGYAQFYLKKAVAIFDKTGATKGSIVQKKCLALSHLALISYEQKNLEEAMAHFNQATSVYEKITEEGGPKPEIDALLVAFGEKMGGLASQALKAMDLPKSTL